MKGLPHTEGAWKLAFTASAIVAGAAGAITGRGSIIIDTQSGSTDNGTSIIKNISGNDVKFDATDVVFVCAANQGAGTVTFNVLESDTGTITSGRLTSGTAVSGATKTIAAADETRVAIIRVRLDRGTITKRYFALNCEAAAADAVETMGMAYLHCGSGQCPITQDLAAVSVE